MSSADTTPRKGNDLDFLKSIVGEGKRRSISRIDEEDEDDSFYNPRPRTSHGNRSNDNNRSSKVNFKSEKVDDDRQSKMSSSTYQSRNDKQSSYRGGRRNSYDSDSSSSSSGSSYTSYSSSSKASSRDDKKSYSTNNTKYSEEDKKTTAVISAKVELPSQQQPKQVLTLKEQLEQDLENYRARKGSSSGSRTEMWARGELSDTQVERQRSHERRVSHRPPPRPRSSRPRSAKNNNLGYQVVVDPMAHRLERKYNELKQLLIGSRPEEIPLPKSGLIKMATKMAHKYHMESQGLVPGGVTSSGRRQNSFPDLVNGLRDSQSPRPDQDEYILIDGTGTVVRTTKVRFISDREPPANGIPPRGRNRVKRAKKKPANAWGSKTNSQASSQRSTPRRKSPISRSRSSSRSPNRSSSKAKSKKKKDEYSDSFDSDTDSDRSRSRSKSPNKGKAVDLHLKYTKNEKLLEWLKTKDEKHKEHRKQKRKEKKEKRKAHKEKIVEKEKLKEKSEEKVKEWMKKKSQEVRLLRRGRMKSGYGKDSSSEDLIVIDEMLDLREHGARMDPSQVPDEVKKRIDETPEVDKKEYAQKSTRPISAHPTGDKVNEKQSAKGRAQSARPFARPPSSSQRKGRFSEGAKEKARQLKEKALKEQEEKDKKRISYNDWVSAKQKESQKTKEPKGNEAEKETTVKKRPPSATKKPEEKSTPIGVDPRPPARPRSSKHRPASGKAAPPTAKTTTPTPPGVPKPQQSDNVPDTPDFDKSKPYNAVKNEQKSWDNFADHVWKEANKSVEEEEATKEETTENPAEKEPEAAETNKVEEKVAEEKVTEVKATEEKATEEKSTEEKSTEQKDAENTPVEEDSPKETGAMGTITEEEADVEKKEDLEAKQEASKEEEGVQEEDNKGEEKKEEKVVQEEQAEEENEVEGPESVDNAAGDWDNESDKETQKGTFLTESIS